MKILGISCGRKNGNSEMLLKSALKEAKEKGAEVEYLRLQDHFIHQCTGCELCSNSDNWPNGRFPESGYFCIYKEDSDHLSYIVDKIKEADGIIISTPIYNLTVPGSLLVLLNRIHAKNFAKHHEIAGKQHTYCATITVGGSDMTNLIKPMLNFTAVELCGSQMNLVDQMVVQFCAPIGYMALKDESVARAAKLGERMADAIAHPEEELYRGGEDNPELCPVCHGDVIQLEGKRFRCPICNIKGDLAFKEDGTPYMKWDGGAELCRLNDNPDEDIVHEKQRAPYKALKENKDKVKEVRDELCGWLDPLPVPELKN